MKANPTAPDGALDVIVVGGGATGLVIAQQLSRASLRCLVLESGPLLGAPPPADRAGYASAVEPLLKVDERRWRHRVEGSAAHWYRVRAAGGRTLLWGGWSIRPDEQNFLDAADLGAPWLFGLDRVHPYVERVERLLGVREGVIDPFFEPVADELELELRPKRAALGADGLRPFVSLDAIQGVRIRPHSVVTQVIRGRDGRVSGVEGIDASTQTPFGLHAPIVVLCASAVETARLLLASELGGPQGPLPAIGKGLVDHLLTSYLVVRPEKPPEAAPGPLERAVSVGRFVNTDGERTRDYSSGFTLEVRGPSRLDQLGPEILANMGLDVASIVDLSLVAVFAIGEAVPHAGRHLTLDPKRKDSLGRAIPVLHLANSEDDLCMARDMDETALAVADVLATPGSQIFPVYEPTSLTIVAHEAGTCRMGTDPETSVTDSFGAVHGVPGLYLGDASVMPTALDRHPTLTLLAMALRTADHLIERVRHGRP
ncbi:MAG: hypothetical protein AUK47_26230 [Deltaproteobacteria bacterium CG2_30_63_29]|nr:MAG: hypothetical protein AUK47_26230 [Deltaproteobacteria bacterium CG2_30_63_29]PIW02240.1 MAG: hypothetical protein COW42_02445 [Deltaproteobacteria bacterium CG17_big_fil_post_rev_8_21_14_2_50_63_7]